MAGGATLSVAELEWLVAGLGEAIVAFHAAGTVHGAITPATVLIRRDNGRDHLLLADVGPPHSAGAGLSVGAGLARTADIHAASAVVGRAAFGAGWQVILVPTGPAQATALEPAGTEPLAFELRRGLSPDPAQRHRSISEWTAAVADALTDHAAVVADATAGRTGRRPVVRIVAAALVVLALLLAAASITRTSSTDDGSGPTPPARPAAPA